MLEFDGPVLLVGGGRIDQSQLVRYGASLPLVAADSGADAARSSGFEPVAVIGDMDSISSATAYPASNIIHAPDQNSTDFDKTMAAVSAPLIIGLGFLGRRLDHTLAAVNTLAKHYPRPIILLDRYDAVMFSRGDVSIGLSRGERFSIWPLEDQAFRGSEGLEWPLDGLAMRPGGQIGTSNRVVAADGRVAVKADAGSGYLIMLESRSMLALVDAIAPQCRDQLALP